MFKRLYILPVLLLSGCVTVPPIADPAMAQRLGEVIAKRQMADCVVARYKVIGDTVPMATLSLAAKSRATSKIPPLPGTRYVTQCVSGEVYFVEIPDSPDYPGWTMRCDNPGTAWNRGGCISRSDN